MSQLLVNLNKAQLQAVTHGEGPLLIVAGAGTGKTTAIAKRLAYLVESGKAKIEQILTLTFTEKAGQELEERIDVLLPYGFLDLWVHTFHAFCERILKQHGLEIGLPGDFKLLTQTEAWLLVRENLEKFDLDYYKPLGNPTKFIHALLRHFSRCKDEMIFPADYLRYAESLMLDSDLTIGQVVYDERKKYQEIANAYHLYNKLLLDNNALDFGDLIVHTLRLFKERPHLLETYRRQFKYILVDEFQDTNLAQYELIKLLSLPQNNLTVVGDDDQSIYKFRGASISNILHFKKDFPDATLVTLIDNYRSGQNILDKAYQLIVQNNPDRLETRLNINKKLVARNGIADKVEFLACRSGEEEAKKVVEQIQKIRLAADEEAKEISWNDFAILIRSNKEADLFMVALERAGIPFQFWSSSGLFRQNLVLDITAYLKLLDNYHENPALYRILNSSFIGLSYEDLVKITHQAKKKSWSIFEALRQKHFLGLSEESDKKIETFLNMLEKHAVKAKDFPVTTIVYAFLNDSGYLKNLIKKHDKGDLESAKQIIYLKKFYDVVEKFETDHAERRVKNFLDYFNYILESGEEGSLDKNISSGPEAVKIMTIHGAKGLEFKHVFLVNLVEMKFPSINRGEPIDLPEELIKEVLPEGDAHIQEERRLFYVGLTRAKEGLYLTWAENYGGTRKRKPSRFLLEIGLLNGHESKTPIKDNLISESQHLSLQETAIPLNLPTHFSFTQLKTFNTCPYQYRFSHILHIPTKGNASFSFGKTMHLTLQKFYQQIITFNSAAQASLFEVKKPSSGDKKTLKIPTLEDLIRLYEESWIDDWYLDKQQKIAYFEKGKKILKEFYSEKSWSIPKMLEVGFHLNFGGVKLRGQIDRIDQLPDGSVEIIDYKTGEPKMKEKMTLEDKEQLLIYQMAAEKFLKERPSLLSFYYLDGNTKISFIGSVEELNKLENKVLKDIEEIRNSSFPPKPSSFNCRHCDFKDICEFADLS